MRFALGFVVGVFTYDWLKMRFNIYLAKKAFKTTRANREGLKDFKLAFEDIMIKH